MIYKLDGYNRVIFGDSYGQLGIRVYDDHCRNGRHAQVLALFAVFMVLLKKIFPFREKTSNKRIKKGFAMFDAILKGLSGLGEGFVIMHWSNPVMIAIGCILLYLGIKKDVEPLLLVPIGFGAILLIFRWRDSWRKGGF